MIETIREYLNTLIQPHSDTRVHHCRVEAVHFADGCCRLVGTVLDTDTAADLFLGLATRFPAVTFVTDEVRILRRPDPTLLTVGTNLTGLHREPSFLAELLSQLLNGQPVEVLDERDRWVFVRQEDGYLGWTYRPYLVAEPAPVPTHLVAAGVCLLRAEPTPTAPLVGRLLAGTSVRVEAVAEGWLALTAAGGLKGWAAAGDLRSLADLPTTGAEQRRQMVADALGFVGVPYLWGGTTALGCDCSGFVRLLHTLAGLTIPRDADMQFAAGRPVEPPFQPGDLLFFNGSGGQRAIGHVGLSLGGWRMVHASRSRNGVYADDVQAVPHLRESFVAARTFCRE